MHEMKKGFLQDYHRNGEPKTKEEKQREETIGFFLPLGITLFLLFGLAIHAILIICLI